jgi:hypothetical protein
LSKWLSDDKWLLVAISFIGIGKIGKICDEFIFNFGIKSFGLEGTWDIL